LSELERELGAESDRIAAPLPPVTHTDALFADQSQSILDDLVALLGQSSAWNCSDPERSDPQYQWGR
jgi:hypothetical protein